MVKNLGSGEEITARGREIAALLKTLADENRLVILSCLSKGEMCVCQLTECIGIPQNLVSHHLKVLKDAGLVDDERRGRWIFYKIKAAVLEDLLGQVGNLCDCAATDHKNGC